MKSTPIAALALIAATGFSTLTQGEDYQSALKSVVTESNLVSVAMASDNENWYLCGEDGGNGWGNGDNVELLDWIDDDSQKWDLMNISGTQYKLKLYNTSQYLRAYAGSNGWNNNDNVQLLSWNNYGSQKWEIIPATDRGHVHMETANMRLKGNEGSNGWNAGDNVQVRDFLDNWNFRWDIEMLEPVDAPSIAKAPNGDLVVYVRKTFQDGSKKGYIFRSSTGNPDTWTQVWSTNANIYGPTLFTHSNKLYMLACIDGKLRIKVSTNNGSNWSDHWLATISEGAESGGGCPVLIVDNYIYYGFMDKGGPGGFPTINRLRVASCSLNDDITSHSNWTLSSAEGFPSTPVVDDTRNGWMEPNLVKYNNKIMLFARVDSLDGYVIAALRLSNDRTNIEFTNQTITQPGSGSNGVGFLEVPFGGSAKFHILQDGSKYYIMSNPHNGVPVRTNAHQNHTMPTDERFYDRNQLALFSTTNFSSFTQEAILIEDDLINDAQHSVDFQGFQQPSFIIDGSTIKYVSRTAYGTFDNYHDANMITYHEHSLN